MNGLGWLDDLVMVARCPNCGKGNYRRGDVRIFFIYGCYWFLGWKCPNCEAKSSKIVIPEMVKSVVRPLSADHVLDAHERLRDFAGDVRQLFSAVTNGDVRGNIDDILTSSERRGK